MYFLAVKPWFRYFFNEKAIFIGRIVRGRIVRWANCPRENYPWANSPVTVWLYFFSRVFGTRIASYSCQNTFRILSFGRIALISMIASFSVQNLFQWMYETIIPAIWTIGISIIDTLCFVTNVFFLYSDYIENELHIGIRKFGHNKSINSVESLQILWKYICIYVWL